MRQLILNPTDEELLQYPYAGLAGDTGPVLLWIDEDFDDVLKGLHQRYAERAVAAYGGRTRNVFEMPGGYVVKLPKNIDGLVDNEWEGSVSNSDESLGNPDYVQYPRTRLAYHAEIPVVFMEVVKPLCSQEIEAMFGAEPDWTLNVDGGQVGVNRSGRLVAYDYGLK